MKKYILVFIILVIYFGGLNSVRELTDLAIVKAVGIDMDENGEYIVSAIVVDTKNKEGKNEGIVYYSKGKSVHEAARNMIDISPKKLYIAHMESLIVSEDIAKDNLENTLDFFIRDNEGSNSFFLFIAKDNTSLEYIEKINEEEIDLVSFLKSTQKYKGNANLKTLNDILKVFLEKGMSLCVNVLSMKEDNVAINNMAYFKDEVMAGYLSEEESKMYNTVINEVDNILVSAGSEDDLAVLELISPKTKVNVKDKNIVQINIFSDAHITQIGKKYKLETIAEKEEVERIIEEKIKNNVYDLFIKMKDEDIDIYSLGNLLYRKKNEIFSDERYLDNIKVEVNVDINIVNTGGIKKVW